MTTLLERAPVANPPRANSTSASCGVAGGAVATTCCSVGLLGSVTWAAGINAGFFTLDKVSPVGSVPILFVGALLLTALVTWGLARRRVAGLPTEVARTAIRRSVGVGLFTGVATYFVFMEIVIPILFIATGQNVRMGMFF